MTASLKKLIFIGCEQFGSRGFEVLLNSNKLKPHMFIAGVITAQYPGKDRQIVRDIARGCGIPVFDGKISSPSAYEWIAGIAPDYGIMMEYIYKIPANILGLFSGGIINVHSSDLPAYRGACPLESLIVNNEDLVITVHKVTPEFDEGPWLVKTSPLNIENLDFTSLSRLASVKGAGAAEKALEMLADGTAVFNAQDNSKLSFCWEYNLKKLLTVDWANDTVDKIHRKVLAGDGAICFQKTMDGKTELLIRDAFYQLCEHNYAPGKVVGRNGNVIKVAAKGGFLMISSLTDMHSSACSCSFNKILDTLGRCETDEITLV